MVPPNLLASLVAQQVNKIATEVQQEAMLAGHSKRLLEVKTEHFLTKLVTKALEQVDKTAAGHQQMLGVRDWTRAYDAQQAAQQAGPVGLTTAPDPTPTPAPPAHVSFTPGTPGQPQEGGAPAPVPIRPPEPEPERETVKQRYSEGAESAKSMTMTSVSKKVADTAAQYLSERAPNYAQDMTTGEFIRYDNDGNEVGRIAPDDPNYARTAAHIRQTAFVTRNLAQFAAGRGLAMPLLGTVAKAAGPIGWAVTAYEMGARKFQEQYKDQAPYVRTFGQEGTGFFAASERFGEFKSGIRGSLGLSRITGDRARETYRQAAGLGLRGDSRDQARDFANDMWLKFGMETGDAMDVVRQSITDGNLSLREYSDTIRGVSKAAVESGRISSQAIKDLVDTQHYVAQRVVSGNASTQIAGDISRIATKLPREVSDALGGTPGIGQLLGNQTAMQTIAMQTGQDPMAATWRLYGAGGATAVQEAGRLLAGGADVVVERVAALFGMTKQQLRSEAREESGGATELSRDQRDMLWLRWCGGDERRAGMMLSSLAIIMRTYGYPETGSAMLETFFQMALGTFGQKAGAGKRDGLSHKSVGIKFHKGGGDDARSELLSDTGYGKSMKSRGGRLGGSVAVQHEPDDSGAFDSYAGVVSKTGIRNRAIERLLSPKGQDKISDISGHKDAGDAKFRVYDKEGKWHNVSLAEAIENPTYRGQLGGRASVLGKRKGDLESVSEITGIKSKSQAVAGQPSKGGGGRTLIDLTPRAAQLFQFMGPSNSQRRGVPSPGWLNPAAYPNYGGN